MGKLFTARAFIGVFGGFRNLSIELLEVLAPVAFAQPSEALRVTVIGMPILGLGGTAKLAGLAFDLTLANQFGGGCSDPDFV
jgi:hypothetical protein